MRREVRYIEHWRMMKCASRIYLGKTLKYLWELSSLRIGPREICGNSIIKQSGFIIQIDLKLSKKLTINSIKREYKINLSGLAIIINYMITSKGELLRNFLFLKMKWNKWISNYLSRVINSKDKLLTK